MHTQLNTPSNFESAYQKLNPEQKIAVDTIQGPVIVYAGPGTGKTNILTVRLANILKQTEVDPSNILCLTFTNSGVISIKEKLKKLIGKESEKIAIHTYHSFANIIISKSGRENIIGQTNVLSSANAFMLAESLLSNSTKAGPFTTKKPQGSKYLKSLIATFAQFKKEALDEGMLENLIEESVFKLENDPENKESNGELNSKTIQEINKLREFKSVGTLYTAFNDTLEKKKKYEYEDLLNYALVEMYTNLELIHELQLQYQYVLVDEFQDTNYKQLRIIQLLMNGIEKPNLFIVGDDDQCIYKFQGALETSIQELENQFGSFHKITLKHNYRSIKQILNAAHTVIKKNPNRPVEKTNELISNFEYAENISEPNIFEFQSTEQEAYETAISIQKMLKKGYEPNSIAVLTRKRAYANNLISWLNYLNISFCWNDNSGNILEEMPGKMIHFALQYLVIKKNDSSASTSVMVQLLKLKFEESRIKNAFIKYRKNKNTHQEFTEWIENNPEMIDIKEWLSYENNINVNHRLSEQEIIAFFQWLGLDNIRNEESMKNIFSAWDNFFTDFLATDLNPTFESLARILQYHIIHDLKIPFDRELDKNSILLSTIHGSKGLEFPIVYMIGCNKNQWENATNRDSTISIPDSIKRSMDLFTDSIEDLRRLAYVGITRAKECQNISFVQSNKNSKSASFWVGSILESDYFAITYCPNLNIDSYKLEKTNVEKNELELILIKEELENFVLSPSALNSYLDSPELFYDQHVLKIPDLSNEAMSFGTAVHSTLEILIKEWVEGIPNKEALSIVWESSLKKMQHCFDPLRYKQYATYGNKLLIDYLPKLFPLKQNAEYILEKNMQAEIDGVKIKGRIDLIIKEGYNIKVVDFKTGNIKSKLKPFVSNLKTGDSYWRQAAIYGSLVKQHYPDCKSVTVEFHFLGNNKIESINMEINLSNWNEFLKTVWKSIHSLQIPRYFEKKYWS